MQRSLPSSEYANGAGSYAEMTTSGADGMAVRHVTERQSAIANSVSGACGLAVIAPPTR